MKSRKLLIMTGLMCFFMLSGLTKTVAQDVQVGITLPYSGNFNNWTITFTNESTNEVFYFQTDDSNFQSGILGNMPAGTYTISFDCPYFPWEGFDVGVCGDNYYQFKARNSGFDWYHAVIDATTYIQIDAGY